MLAHRPHLGLLVARLDDIHVQDAEGGADFYERVVDPRLPNLLNSDLVVGELLDRELIVIPEGEPARPTHQVEYGTVPLAPVEVDQ